MSFISGCVAGSTAAVAVNPVDGEKLDCEHGYNNAHTDNAIYLPELCVLQ